MISKLCESCVSLVFVFSNSNVWKRDPTTLNQRNPDLMRDQIFQILKILIFERMKTARNFFWVSGTPWVHRVYSPFNFQYYRTSQSVKCWIFEKYQPGIRFFTYCSSKNRDNRHGSRIKIQIVFWYYKTELWRNFQLNRSMRSGRAAFLLPGHTYLS